VHGPLSDERRRVLAQSWLEQRGYKAEFDPALVATGRRPDFLCHAIAEVQPPVLWAEGKSIEPDDTSLVLSQVWPVLKSLAVPPGLTGHAMLHATPATRQQSVRALLKMFYGKASNYSAERCSLVFIQQSTDQTDVRYIEVKGDVPQHVW